MRPVSKFLKRWLVLAHRWLGIGTGLFFATWVLSGLVMMYVGFPALTEAERLARQAPIAWDRVVLGPGAILGGAGSLDPSLAVSLFMRGGEPVYAVVAEDGGRRVISATTGLERGPVTPAESAAFLSAQADAGLGLDPVGDEIGSSGIAEHDVRQSLMARPQFRQRIARRHPGGRQRPRDVAARDRLAIEPQADQRDQYRQRDHDGDAPDPTERPMARPGRRLGWRVGAQIAHSPAPGRYWRSLRRRRAVVATARMMGSDLDPSCSLSSRSAVRCLA